MNEEAIARVGLQRERERERERERIITIIMVYSIRALRWIK
jgi:hypothetical protein